MEGLSSAAAVLQVLGNAISVALRTARFMNDVRNAEEFQSDFFQGLQLSLNTVSLLTSQLNTESEGQPYDQEIREIHKLVREISKDCRKCHNILVRLYNSPNNTIVGRISGEIKREIRRSEIESVNARFRSNVASIQVLLSVLQLCVNSIRIVVLKNAELLISNYRIASGQQTMRTERLEDRLQDIQAKLRPLRGLREKLLASLNSLHDNRKDSDKTQLSGLMSPTFNRIVLSRDTSACMRSAEGTLKTANSICAKVSSIGSVNSLPLSGDNYDRPDSPHDTSVIQFRSKDGDPISLSTLTTFLDTYIQELNKEFEMGSYEKCRMYIQEALDWGEYRYLEYDVDFHQWFDLQIRLAEVYEKEGKLQEARKYLIFLRHCSDINDVEYRRISKLQEVQLHCATARLFLREYERGHTKALDELKQQAFTAFGAADTFFRAVSISEGGLTSVNPAVQQLLVDSAMTLDKVYGILADTAGRRSLRVEHTILREMLPQLTFTTRSSWPTVPTPRPYLHELDGITIPNTDHSRTPSISGSSEVCTASPLSIIRETSRLSKTLGERQSSELRGTQSPKTIDEVYRESMHSITDSGVVIKATDSDQLTKLFNAAKSHNLQSLKDDLSEFLRHINTQDEAGMNVLHHVLTTLGGEEDIKMLISNGVDVNACDNHGDTPLHYCVRRNNVKGAKLLLRTKEVIIDTVNHSNQTPAQLAINQSGMFHTDMLRLLIRYKADFSWPGIPRDIDDSLRRLAIQERNGSPREQTRQGRRDSRASESSHSSQKSRWLRAIGRNSSDS